MVLVTFDWNKAIPRFAAHNGGDNERVRQFLANPYHDAFERNQLSPDEFFTRGRELAYFDGTVDEFQSYWNEIFAEIPQNVAILRTLAPNIPTYALSNTNPWHAEYLEREFDWMDLFHKRLYSYALGARKPEPRIFEQALEHAHVEPAHVLLIDDRPENIAGAQELGMQTIHVTSPQVLKSNLEAEFPELLTTSAHSRDRN